MPDLFPSNQRLHSHNVEFRKYLQKLLRSGISGSHSVAAGDSGFIKCGEIVLSKWFMTFGRVAMSSPSGFNSPRRTGLGLVDPAAEEE